VNSTEASGFSPDGHTFLDAFVNGPATAALTVVNLRDGSTVVDDGATDRAGFWEFSPCGGTLARVVPTDTDQIATLYSTADGRQLGSAHVPFTAVTLTANADNDVVSYTDGNGMRGASRIPVRGQAVVAKFLKAFAPHFWADTSLTWMEANGRPSVLISRDGGIVGLLTISASADGIDQLMWVLSPDKLNRISIPL